MVAFFDLFLFGLIVLCVLTLISKLVPKQELPKKRVVNEAYVSDLFKMKMLEQKDPIVFCDKCGRELDSTTGPYGTQYDKLTGKLSYAEYAITCNCKKYKYLLKVDYSKDDATIEEVVK